MKRSARFSFFSFVAALLAVNVPGCAADTDDEEIVASESELSIVEVVTAGTTLRVTGSRLNLRASGSTSAAVLDVLTSGERVTCASTSGETGWVHVRTNEGKTGWVFGKYVEREGEGEGKGGGESSVSATSSGGSCNPALASAAVGRYQKALHDTIAWAEGTRGRSNDGYDVMFANKIAKDCRQHPNVCTAFGSTCSTAAGRYQFLKKTWSGVASARGLGSFGPDNQERAAAYLVNNVRRVTVPSSRPMSAAELSNALTKLSYEWASLPPSRYGQGAKTPSEVRATYCKAAGC